MKDWLQDDIDAHYKQHVAGEGTEYLGRTLNKLRRNLAGWATRNASEAESEGDSLSQQDKRIDETIAVLHPVPGPHLM